MIEYQFSMSTFRGVLAVPQYSFGQPTSWTLRCFNYALILKPSSLLTLTCAGFICLLVVIEFRWSCLLINGEFSLEMWPLIEDERHVVRRFCRAVLRSGSREYDIFNC